MDIEQMLETEARFRLGSASNFTPTEEEVAREAGRRPDILFGFDTAAHRPLDFNRWRERLTRDPVTGGWHFLGTASGPLERRNADLAAELRPFGDVGRVFADMRDCVERRDPAFPILQYNRRRGTSNSVLWPLDQVHRIGGETFFGSLPPDPVRFRDKKPILFWRGNLTGKSNLDGDQRRARVLFTQFRDGEIGEDLFRAHLETIPRFRFVSRYGADPRFDLGFVLRGGLQQFADNRHIAPYLKSPSTRAETISHKYPLALEGTDVATVFGWVPEANVLTFRETYSWEVFFDCHFSPGIDYLGISPDYADVIERFDWAESHPADCIEMMEHAQAVARVIGTERFRARSNGALLDLYGAAARGEGREEAQKEKTATPGRR